MRFGIVYPDRAAVVKMLTDHATEFRHELNILAGWAEWTVKVYLDEPPDDEPASVASHAATSPGLGFLSRERERRLRRARQQEHAREAVAEVVAALDALALDRVDLPPAPSPSEGTPCLAATYLVERADEQRFVAGVEGIRPDDDRLRIAIDGPWPPFHFTELRLGCADG